MKKKLFSLALLLALCLAVLQPALAQTVSLPISQEKITLTAMITRQSWNTVNFEDLPVVRAFEEETNIHINWVVIPAESETERIGLAFASGDLPDLFFGTRMPYDVVIRNAAEGTILPLNDLIEQYCPNLVKRFSERPDIKADLTFPDGKIYGLAKIDEKPLQSNQDNMFINKAWLQKAGLAVPTTLDEFYAVLKAFKETDFNGNGAADEVPFTFLPGAASQGIHSLFGSFGVVDTPSTGTHFMVKDGQLVYVPAMDEYRKGLDFFHKLYAEGLIDMEVFTQTGAQYSSKVQEGNIGVFMAWQADSFAADADNWAHVLPMKGANSEQMWYRTPGVAGLNINGSDTGIFFAVTNKNKYVAETMKWIDYLCTGTNNLRQFYGTEGTGPEAGTGWYWNEDKLWVRVSDPAKALSDNAYSATMSFGPFTPSMLTYDEIISRQKLPAPAAKKNAREAEYSQFYPKEELPAFKLTLEEVDAVSRITVDLGNEVDNMQAYAIINGISEGEWQEYVKNLQALGLEKYTQVYATAFARMK